MVSLINEIATQNNPDEIKQMGALVFKNFVSNRGNVSCINQNKLIVG